MRISVKKKGDFKFKERFQNSKRLKSNLPVVIANMALNHFLEGFRKGGGQTDASRGGWKKRQFTRGKGGRATLIKSGILRRSLMVRKVSWSSITINTGQLTRTYASIHNEGGNIPITAKMRAFFWFQSKNEALTKVERNYWRGMALKKGSSIKIPKREYLGKSSVLNNKIIRKVDFEIKKILTK